MTGSMLSQNIPRKTNKQTKTLTEQGFTFYWEKGGKKFAQRAMEVHCLTVACQTCNLPVM